MLDDKSGNRDPSVNELAAARDQGRHVAEIAAAVAEYRNDRTRAAE